LAQGLRTQEAAEDLERDHGEHQDNDEEDDRAVLELAAARGFDAVQYPVGGEIKPDGDQREVNYFHVICVRWPDVARF
jgi:hypothetical protein